MQMRVDSLDTAFYQYNVINPTGSPSSSEVKEETEEPAESPRRSPRKNSSNQQIKAEVVTPPKKSKPSPKKVINCHRFLCIIGTEDFGSIPVAVY